MSELFKLVSNYSPKGDQVKAIESITKKFNNGINKQVLLGVTGTGKTFTFANVIKKMQKKTLVLVHNKTLAAQIYLELKELFPENKVEYFVSYFDYYQPEAYIPKSDLYIEKSSQINNEIEMMRLSTLTSLYNSNDVIVVGSVAAIYPSVAPKCFQEYVYQIKIGQKITIKEFRQALVNLNYQRNDINLSPKNFRCKGDTIDVCLGYTNKFFVRVSFFGDVIESIVKIDYLTIKKIETLNEFTFTAANEYIADKNHLDLSIQRIKDELHERIKFFNKENLLLEAQRIEQRTNYDLEAIQEFGFCSGIENYACHLELRAPNSTPYTIFDYFNQNNDWLLIIDESHMTLPQIRGMYETDRSRKQTIVEYGFRLPSALDNRPLNYDEFLSKLDKVLFVSATPNDWEINYSNNEITEQIVRPTGLLDPEIFVRPTKYQMDDLLKELKLQKDNNERTLITVMTIRMAEELTHFLQQHNVKCTFLHNELKTLERYKIINNMRRGLYDAIIGINLLREGLDIPEVSLVVIFDADKPGFFRSEKSLIQIIGRAARNANGRVIMYGDEITNAMQIAIEKTSERRRIQMEYNKINNIIPQTIIKQIPSDITILNEKLTNHKRKKNSSDKISLDAVNENIAELEKQMLLAANEQNYELAAQYRDLILELKSKNQS